MKTNGNTSQMSYIERCAALASGQTVTVPGQPGMHRCAQSPGTHRADHQNTVQE
jgi:hypothetical protein